MLKKWLSVCLLCCWGLLAAGQEFNCKVVIYHDKITGVDPVVFANMQKALNDFMNTQKWTTDEFAATEKIECNILLNLTANNVNGDPDTYMATFSIQASRPVFNATYTSPLINFIDKELTFRFTQFTSVHFDDNQVSGTDPAAANLTAVFAFYSYLTLALDYDSFAPDGGTAFLKKAQNVVNNAPEGKGVNGWKAVENTHNRYWLTDELLNTRFSDVRKYWYTLHREGLDSMYAKPVDARTRILVNLKKLYLVNKENPSSILMQFFFNAKGDELLHILAQSPKSERGSYITLLDAMDVPNANKYNSLK